MVVLLPSIHSESEGDLSSQQTLRRRVGGFFEHAHCISDSACAVGVAAISAAAGRRFDLLRVTRETAHSGG